MSWLDDVVDFGSSIIGGVSNFFGSNNIGSNVLKTVMTGVALNKVTNSINKSNDATRGTTNSPAKTAVDPGVCIQTRADTEQKIPVLYGRAIFGGSQFDVRMSSDNKTMYFCYVLCENTGTLLSTGQASAISFNSVYYNDQRIVFQGDGITANYSVDRNGTIDNSLSGLVKIYLYRNGSASSSQAFTTGTSGTQANAYSIVPGWTSAWSMTGLAFAVVRIEYNKEKGITGIGNLRFDMQSSMSFPGDVLYDIMTNTKYGAGIPPGEINSA